MFKKLLLAATASVLLASQASAEDVTLKLVQTNTSPESLAVLDEVIKKFEADNPGVKVEMTAIPWDQAFEKFATMIGAGDIPDVAEMPDSWTALYVNAGALEDLAPYLDKWEQKGELNERAIDLSHYVGGKAYVLPYGFFVRAMLYNKQLFKEAGVEGAPETIEQFMEAAKKVSALPGKYGYCLRGSTGGLSGWAMMGAAANGDNNFFREDGTSTMADAGWVKGYQMLIDIYKNGYAPKDSVNWGYKEIVAGFYTGTCAMLDQDADVIPAVNEHLGEANWESVPMPKGANGKAFPALSFGSWSMMAKSEHKDLAWKLIAALDGPEGNLAWNKAVGALPIYKSAVNDPAYSNPKFKGWFDSLSDANVVPTILPAYLPEFPLFQSSVSVKSSQQALLGEISAEELGAQWAEYLTKAQQKFLQKK